MPREDSSSYPPQQLKVARTTTASAELRLIVLINNSLRTLLRDNNLYYRNIELRPYTMYM